MRQHEDRRERQGGFTLVELLITIVVIGVLTAVAIVGVGGINNNGKKAACQSTMDAAKAAGAAHFANTGDYPQTFAEMTGATPGAELEVPPGVTENPTTLKKGTTWTLTLTPNGAANQTTYACSF